MALLVNQARKIISKTLETDPMAESQLVPSCIFWMVSATAGCALEIASSWSCVTPWPVSQPLSQLLPKNSSPLRDIRKIFDLYHGLVVLVVAM